MNKFPQLRCPQESKQATGPAEPQNSYACQQDGGGRLGHDRQLADFDSTVKGIAVNQKSALRERVISIVPEGVRKVNWIDGRSCCAVDKLYGE